MSSPALMHASGISARATVYGFQTAGSSTNRYGTASPGGEAGSSSGFGVAWLGRVDSQTGTSITRNLAARFLTAAGGWALQTLTTNATARCLFVNGVGTNVSTPSYTIASGSVGKWIVFVAVHDGSTKVHLYAAGTEAGTGTVIVGYTAQSTGMAWAAAATSGGGTGMDLTHAGLITFTGVPTATDITNHYAATKLAKRLTDMGGTGVVMTHRHSLRADGGDVACPTTVLDKVGSDSMTKTGTPIWVKDNAPVWV